MMVISPAKIGDLTRTIGRSTNMWGLSPKSMIFESKYQGFQALFYHFSHEDPSLLSGIMFGNVRISAQQGVGGGDFGFCEFKQQKNEI
jgi:hypothetical protein